MSEEYEYEVTETYDSGEPDSIEVTVETESVDAEGNYTYGEETLTADEEGNVTYEAEAYAEDADGNTEEYAVEASYDEE
jgi:hypothetical protein